MRLLLCAIRCNCSQWFTTVDLCVTCINVFVRCHLGFTGDRCDTHMLPSICKSTCVSSCVDVIKVLRASVAMKTLLITTLIARPVSWSSLCKAAASGLLKSRQCTTKTGYQTILHMRYHFAFWIRCQDDWVGQQAIHARCYTSHGGDAEFALQTTLCCRTDR